MHRIIEGAVADATTLRDAGFDALIVENFGDAPFHADDVPDVTVAAMTAAVGEIAQAVDIPIGVNVLRNDAIAALAVATVTGASFIRVNVVSGTMFTDQGPIVGRAAEIAQARSAWAHEVEVLGDVFVKHATPPAGQTLEAAAVDLWERGGVDGVVVSGTGTGAPTSLDDLRRVRDVLPDAPLIVGSGATVDTAADLLEVANGLIVGSSLKAKDLSDPIDRSLAEKFVQVVSP